MASEEAKNANFNTLTNDVLSNSLYLTELNDNLYNNINRIDEALYNNKIYIDFASTENDEALANFNIITRYHNKLTIESKTFASQAFIPLLLPPGTYNMSFVFHTQDDTTNIRLFDSTKSQQLHVFNSGIEWNITIEEETLYYIRLYILAANKTLTITDAYVYNYKRYKELLYNKIGPNQFTEDIQKYFKYVVDTFADSEQQSNPNNVTVIRDGNDINITTTDSSSYIYWKTRCITNHKYAIYYEINGTYSDGNYLFQLRLVNGNWKKLIQIISQTTGALSSGSIVFTVADGEAGDLAINMPDHIGQNITGKIYLYDVTNFTDQQINSIDFQSVGANKTFFFGDSSNQQSENSWWEDKKVVFYGDSITQMDYPQRIQAKMGFTLIKNAVGGSRFTYHDANSLSSDSRITQIVSDTDVIFIMGGTNDWQWSEIEEELIYNNGFDRSKFKGAVAYTIQKMQEQCPNATIYLCTNIGGRGDADPSIIQSLPIIAQSGAGIGNTPLKIRDATIEVANILNIPVIDTWNCGINGFNRSLYISDTVHPNANGCQKIADYIVNYLKQS